ncbi:MAG: 1-deoxy-D-xylulose-5-phosphate reductoisomerase [Acidimicrobiia bacterium]|nr:1-deoxy-D-xylulose-5-phosphate reductoisomerase [Acidimicrobiia bacterium]
MSGNGAATRRRLVLLGSTGSIGTQALDVCRRHPDRFEVVALAAATSVDEVVRQAWEFRPQAICVAAAPPPPAADLPPGVAVCTGAEGLVELAAMQDCDVVLNGVVGMVGLRATVAALEAGRTLALANKESLVAGGPVVRAARERGGGRLVPVDSEHAASAQVLRGEPRDEIARLVLTASGGPFRGLTRAELAAVTVEQALHHPTWSMGAKITIDSATLFNKGLEVIEAHELFDLSYDQIGVVVHPQSIVHAILELVDGSAKAQMGLPDMRQPIAWALAYPDRLDDPVGRIDWATLGDLTFELPDTDAFPALGLARAAGRAGGDAPAVLNAANEEAVAAFLAGGCGFLDVPAAVEETLARHEVSEPCSVDDVVAAEAWARETTRERLAARIG